MEPVPGAQTFGDLCTRVLDKTMSLLKEKKYCSVLDFQWHLVYFNLPDLEALILPKK